MLHPAAAEPLWNPRPDNFVCTDPNSCAGNTYQTSEFQSEDPSADENEFVNYTKVAADYREYGERTPATRTSRRPRQATTCPHSIPPSIEDEVVDYEEEIKLTEDNGQSDEAGMGRPAKIRLKTGSPKKEKRSKPC